MRILFDNWLATSGAPAMETSMVSPVTGPYFDTVNLKGPPNQFGFSPNWTIINRKWYRQRKPYDQPLAFELTKRLVIASPDGRTTNAEASPNFAGYNANVVYNKVYAKFVAQLGDSSQWGVNFAEFSQSMSMINSRAMQLYRFARKLNRFDFPGAANELKKGLKPPKGLKPGSKWFANNWLEFHFGWEPLVKDIGAGIETLQSTPSPKRISVRDRGVEDVYIPSGSHYGTSFRYRYDTGVAIRAKVSVSNPNLYVANQLGFVNPLSIAWELVPFSFCVDWFANVGQVLNSLTDFMGLDISQASVTKKQVIDLTNTTVTFDTVAQQDIGLVQSWKSVYVIRSLGIPGPTLLIKPFKGFSLARGATAISLLLQQMR